MEPDHRLQAAGLKRQMQAAGQCLTRLGFGDPQLIDAEMPVTFAGNGEIERGGNRPLEVPRSGEVPHLDVDMVDEATGMIGHEAATCCLAEPASAGTG